MNPRKNMQIPSTLEKKRKTVVPEAIVLVVVIAAIDWFTGYEVSFSIFYLWPIILTAWNREKVFTFGLSLASALLWVEMDLAAGHVYSQAWIPCWNAATRLGFFLITATLTMRFKRELDTANELARLDSTTGLYNSRAFMEILKVEIERTRRFRRPVTLMYMDLDHFKRLNDEFGHDRGDAVLALFSTALRTNIRKYDVAARLGGDEFAVLLPETSQEQGRAAVLKLKGILMRVFEEEAPFVTISIGVVTQRNPEGVQHFIRAADDLMYEVKESGKNDVRFRDML